MIRPVICVSVGNVEFSGLLEMLQTIGMAEIRLDLMSLSPTEANLVFSSHSSLIATCRIGKNTESERYGILENALNSGAAYVDLELESPLKERIKLIETARKLNRKVIISYHNFNKTPGEKELKIIMANCFEAGADIAKIACMVNSTGDNARLLSLYSNYKNLVTVGMGQKGLITRVAAPFLGAPFTYAGIENRETAPGQPSYNDLENLFRLIDSAE